MELYLIRHGESANNVLVDLNEHHADPELTPLGHQQASKLAHYLARQPVQFTHLFCSPMHRALQTAQPIAQQLDLVPEIWLYAHEHGGIGRNEAGLGRAAIDALFPGCVLPSEITDNGWFQGTDDLRACYSRAERIAALLDGLERDAPDGNILLVTHGTFISVLLQVILQMPDDDSLYIIHDNTGITRLSYLPERKLLRYVNRIDHLR